MNNHFKYFISPDKVLYSEKEAVKRKYEYYTIIYNKLCPHISIYNITYYFNTIKVNCIYDDIIYDSSYMKNQTLYRSINMKHNTNYYSNKIFFNGWSIQGILERYLLYSIPHLNFFKDNNNIYLKSSFPTYFKDDIFPNIINSNFNDILKQYVSNKTYNTILEHKQREIDFLETII